MSQEDDESPWGHCCPFAVPGSPAERAAWKGSASCECLGAADSGSCQPNPCRLILAASLPCKGLESHWQGWHTGVHQPGHPHTGTWPGHLWDIPGYHVDLLFPELGSVWCHELPKKLSQVLGFIFVSPCQAPLLSPGVSPSPVPSLSCWQREWEDLGVGFMHIPQPKPVSVSWLVPHRACELSLAYLRSW